MKSKVLAIVIALFAIVSFVFVSCNNPLATDSVTQTKVERSGTNALVIYVKASSAPYIWAWESGGKNISELMGYSWSTQPQMAQATTSDMQVPSGWYSFAIDSAYVSSP